MRLWFMAPFAFLAGCISNKPVALPDGTAGLAIDCSGTAYNWSHCMNKAAKACAGPYQVLSQDGNSPGVIVIPGAVPMLMNAINRTMLVKCGAAQ